MAGAKKRAVAQFNITVVAGYNEHKKPIWHTIGNATQLEDGQLRCTIRSIPINWDGEFVMFPKDHNERKFDSERERFEREGD